MEKLKKKYTKKDVFKLCVQSLVIMIGTLVMSFGYMVFLSPHNIVPGGFMGLARIIHDLLSNIGFNFISMSLWYLILNVFLYIYAVKVLGIEFGIRSGVGIASYSIFTSIFENAGFINNLITKFQTESASFGGGVYILYAIYGGIIMGIGIGLIFRANGSTGGSDIVAVVVNKFFPTITTGQIVMFVDGLVVVMSVIAYGSLVLPLYALITIFVFGKISDVFVDGVKSLRAYYILTEKKEEITERIFNEVKRGVTYIKCEGMFSRQEKSMLFVILRRSQIMQLKKIVKEVDPNSFMFSQLVKDAYGQGFLPYEKQSSNKGKGLFANLILNKKSVNSKEINQNEIKDEISQNEIEEIKTED
ncbi:MAG: YitT family protein [Clostridia bacterium]|nr:YitT family protein [Clostridia bacterium]